VPGESQGVRDAASFESFVKLPEQEDPFEATFLPVYGSRPMSNIDVGQRSSGVRRLPQAGP
jgi:hypothetical protein